MSNNEKTYLLEYNAYVKIQDGSGSLGDQLPCDKRKVKLAKVDTPQGTILVSATGSLHSNIFDSHITCFVFTPIEEWDKPVIKEFSGERCEKDNYIGLVFTCRDKFFVISGSCLIKLDVANVNFETNIDTVTEYEREKCYQGAGWRSRYFNGNDPSVTSIGKAVYSHYHANDNVLYNILIRTPKGHVDFYLGDSPKCIEKLDSILNQSSGRALVDNSTELATDIVHTFQKNYSKADQLSLF
jgi:hypothetical protein